MGVPVQQAGGDQGSLPGEEAPSRFGGGWVAPHSRWCFQTLTPSCCSPLEVRSGLAGVTTHDLGECDRPLEEDQRVQRAQTYQRVRSDQAVWARPEDLLTIMSTNPTTVPGATPVAPPSPVLPASISVGSQLLGPGGRASRTPFQEDISQEAGSILKTEQSSDPSCWAVGAGSGKEVVGVQLSWLGLEASVANSIVGVGSIFSGWLLYINLWVRVGGWCPSQTM